MDGAVAAQLQLLLGQEPGGRIGGIEAVTGVGEEVEPQLVLIRRTIGCGTNPSPFDRSAWATPLTPLQVSAGFDLSIGGPKDEVEAA